MSSPVHHYNKIFTGIPDIDRETLLKLDEETLNGACTINRYAQSLCNNDFWRMRLLRLLDAEGETIRFDGDFRALYKQYLGTMSHQWIETAAIAGHLDIVRILMDQTAEIEEEHEFALERAAQLGHLDIVKLLVKRGIDPRLHEDSPLLAAVGGGQYEVVKYFLNPPINADPNAFYDSEYEPREYAIVIAVKKGYDDVVKLLLKHGADPTVNNNEAFIVAAQNDRLELIRLLLQYTDK